jgi:formaldehyde-activating enzyme involved in methanogenesis
VVPLFHTVLPAVVFHVPEPSVTVAPSPVAVSHVQVAPLAMLEAAARNMAEVARAVNDELRGDFMDLGFENNWVFMIKRSMSPTNGLNKRFNQ